MSDLANDYQAHRDEMEGAAAVSEMESLIGAPESKGEDRVSDMSLSDLVTGGYKKAPEAVSEKIGAVAKDIGKGIIESPRAVIKGVRDSAQSVLNLGKEAGDWMDEHGLNPHLIVDSGGLHVAANDAEAKAMTTVNNPVADWLSNPQLPDINAPKSTTGNVIKNVSQFVYSMAQAGKQLNALGVSGTGYGLTTLKGFMAQFEGFDGASGNLANLIQSAPSLRNPVTEFLASKPGDSDAVGRLKNAVTGTIQGVALDGFMKAIKFFHSANAARPDIEEATKIPKEEFNSADVENILVKPNAKGVSKLVVNAKPEDAAKLAEATERTANLAPNDIVGRMAAPVGRVESSAAGRAMEPPKTFINFAHVDTAEDVQRLMQEMTDATAPAADTAKAGARSFQQVKLDAAHQDAWKALISRQSGQPLTDSQTVAARELWASATDKLAQLGKEAAENPSEANLFAFRKMLAVHDVVQREVLGARAATARALNSWRIPVGGDVNALKQIIETNGGSEVSRMLADRMTMLSKAGMVKEMTQASEKGAAAKTIGAVQEVWVNGLLSGPQTHLANMLSNTTVIPLRMAERKVAATIASTLGDTESVATGEASAQFTGMIQGAKDMARYYAKAAKAFATKGEMPESPALKEGLVQAGKIEHPPAISSEAFKISGDTWLGRAVDYTGMLVRAPGSAMQKEDELFKILGYRMELNAQAVRQATKEVTQGTIEASALKSRIAEIIANPPGNIKLAAVDAALYQTFTNAPGKMAQGLSKLTSEYPALKVVLPFVKTPANILKFTFERTPLAPLMSSVRADIAAGGARRDLALAQMAVGTSMMLATADMAMNGRITGRGPIEKGQKEAMQREGWRPYSVKIGDRWVAYNRLDPVGSLMGMSADASELLMQADHAALDDADTEKMTVAMAAAFAGNIVNKTYMSGLSSAIAALNDPNVKSESWAQGLAASIVPSAVNTVEKVSDPTIREVYSMMDAIKARTPGLSSSLPARLDLWGNEMKAESGFGKPFDFFSPVYTSEPKAEPIDKEIERLGANITSPKRRTSMDGVMVELPPKPYHEFVKLAGNELKHPAWGLGAKDLLNQIVSGEHPLSAVYNLKSDGADGGKADMLKDIINQYRDLAKKKVLQDNPELAQVVQSKKEAKQALKLPMVQ